MLAILILLVTSSTLLPESYCDIVTIDTPSGQVIGKTSPRNASVTRFLAVPYAEPPERFEKATVVTPWSDVLNTTEFGPTCYSYGFEALYPASENCLTLDIYTPAVFSLSATESVSTATEKLPVMVYIHGGGFVNGGSAIHEGSVLSAVGRVVVVVIQYRLAAFGFLYTEGITPSNIGLWDQKLALRWVNENIQSYGGDNYQVTILGESAGSISIALHLLSPMTNTSYFQRAILQSGSSLVGEQNKLTKAQQVTDLANLAGCYADKTLAQKVDCLRRVPATRLHNITSSIIKAYYFFPAVDGEFVPYDGFSLVGEYSRFEQSLSSQADYA